MTPRDMALAVLTSVIWGLAFVATKFGLDGFSAPQLTAFRFIVAAVPVLLFLAYAHGMPPGLASVTQQMQVFFTVPLAIVFFRDIPTLRQSLGMVIAFCGLALIGFTVGGDLTFAALGLALAAALSWAIGNILVKFTGPVAMVPLMAWASLVAPLPALALSVILDPDPNLLTAISGAPWLAIASAIYLGTLSTNIAYAAWSHLLTRYPTAQVAPFALLVPCTGVVASAVIFHETFSPIRYLGMALILSGVAVVVLPAGWLRVRRSSKR